MLDLPKPQLGDVTAITITTSDLEKSLQYYAQLGFRELYRFDFPYPFIQITDGALLIMLRKDDTPYIALTYYVKNIEGVVKDLEIKGIHFVNKPRDFDQIKRYLMQSPDGLNISLVDYVEGFYKPEGHSMLTMSPKDYFDPEKYVNKVIGMFGEFAHPVKDLDTSLVFWEKLGFTSVSKNASPYPWAIVSDGLAVVGLHQTEHIKQPAITFFAGDMKEKIEHLKAHGLTDFTEEGNSTNIVLTTPEKQSINLFKLGM